MSQYLHIFVRKDDNFTELNTYCRSSNFYQMFNDTIDIPYGKIRPITTGNFHSVLEYVRESIKGVEQYKADAEDMVSKIMMMNNSVEDKLESILTYQNYIKEYNEDIEELKNLEQEIIFYNQIVYNYAYTDTNTDEVIYMGIECGDEVSKEDIE